MSPIRYLATLPELLAVLQEHGPDALLAEPTFLDMHAEALAYGWRTIEPHEWVRYGGKPARLAWEVLLASHGEELRRRAAEARRTRDEWNDRACARATVDGSFFDETGES